MSDESTPMDPTPTQEVDTGIGPTTEPTDPAPVDQNAAQTWQIPEGKILVDAAAWEQQKQRADNFARIEEDPVLADQILDYYRAKVMGKDPEPPKADQKAVSEKQEVPDETAILRQKIAKMEVDQEVARIKAQYPEMNDQKWQNEVAKVINQATQQGQNIGLEQAYFIVKGQGRLAQPEVPQLQSTETRGVPTPQAAPSMVQSVSSFNEKHAGSDFKTALDAAMEIAAKTAAQ